MKSNLVNISDLKNHIFRDQKTIDEPKKTFFREQKNVFDPLKHYRGICSIPQKLFEIKKLIFKTETSHKKRFWGLTC